MNKIILIVVILLLVGGVYLMFDEDQVLQEGDTSTITQDTLNESNEITDDPKEKVIEAILDRVEIYNSKDVKRIRSYTGSQSKTHAQTIEGLTDTEVLQGVEDFLYFWGNPTEAQLRDQQTEWTFKEGETIVEIYIPQTEAFITLVVDEQGNWE